VTDTRKALCITGSGGYVGRELLRFLGGEPGRFRSILALDVREPDAEHRVDGVEYRTCDVRDPNIGDFFGEFGVDTVVHLAGIVNPGKEVPRDVAYAIDVTGIENVLAACIHTGVGHFITTSSGAAYGYYPDNPVPLHEDAPLRGNYEFAYSYHKRLQEEILARYREEHPALKQLILRIGTVLGERTDNQITALFEKPAIIGITGVSSPWVFVWDQDVLAAILRGIDDETEGVYNVVGDGTLSMREIAKLQGKPYVPMPASLIYGALWLLKKFNATQYGPEQLKFLRYRPVLDNTKLKNDWGFIPQKTTPEAFAFYLEHRSRRGS